MHPLDSCQLLRVPATQPLANHGHYKLKSGCLLVRLCQVAVAMRVEIVAVSLADVYLRMERYDDATACLEEAKLIAPISGPLFFQVR